ncbi:hypothetical protein [Nocardia terpenica]|uniref:hypothetical protein n=1 Tax=Nocardia terpenica TaxID=455432 RepID=UPI002FDF37FA
MHGRSRRRVSIAALACYKPGQRSRLIYRPRHDNPNPVGRKGFGWTDYCDLLIAAHTQLAGPLVVVWDNLNSHTTADMRTFATRHD